ncbi:hypothetical protein AOQ72_19095 [Bradyrhizobium yuanmingense]|jgi:hypothetical protein|uniref:Ribbon-helix-helix protein CopG domain-containing protein n=1 Tax=Bradyrhizobium yuanmingense TaxID=108015 RepID=A0A0R3CJP1_9BRAD|nr:hypothetical protein [Bradyrhizobium yuanmingense]KRP96412.1 hypothetical protein AOQ72_19095 [Bradyrhizobium yuanmingense]
MSERLQLTVDKEDLELIDKIQKLCKLDGRSEVVQEALVLLGWAAAATNDGLTVAAVDEVNNKFREVETKALQRARRRIHAA